MIILKRVFICIVVLTLALGAFVFMPISTEEGHAYSFLSPETPPTTLPEAENYKGNPTVVNSLFPAEHVTVAEFDAGSFVGPYGKTVDLTGEEDVTNLIQIMLDACYLGGGGTVFLPAGKYRITRTIEVRNFVTLCGDWANPDTVTDSNYGTLIIADVPQNDDEQATGLFRLYGSSGVLNITVWYPMQRFFSILPYPYTFDFQGMAFGAKMENFMMATIKNVTMLNSYRGISASIKSKLSSDGAMVSPHEFLSVNNVYGTVLSTGMSVHDSSDIDTFEYVSFDNKYWVNAGPAYNAPSLTELNFLTKARVTGIEMSSMDWPQLVGIHLRGYKYGMRFIKTVRNYNDVCVAYSEILDCEYAIMPEEPLPIKDHYSLMFTRCTLEGSTAVVPKWYKNTRISLLDCDIKGATNGAKVMRANSPRTLNHTAFNPHKPTKNTLYTITPATDSDQDSSPAIQEKLDQAGANGGGIVYLSAGIYNLTAPLSVPAGVELRGCSTVATRDNYGSSDGTVLALYGTAHIDINGDGASLCGLRIWYPKHSFLTAVDFAYPYAVTAHGKNIRIENVTFVNANVGVYLKDCPDHFVRRVMGMAQSALIYVEGASRDVPATGKIEACYGNATFLVRNALPRGAEAPTEGMLYSHVFPNLQASERFILVDLADKAHDEQLLNVFVYGAKSSVYVKSGTAHAVNAGGDTVGAQPFEAGAGAHLYVVNAMYYWLSANRLFPHVTLYNVHARTEYWRTLTRVIRTEVTTLAFWRDLIFLALIVAVIVAFRSRSYKISEKPHRTTPKPSSK